MNHAAAVVRPDRTFVCHLIDTMALPRRRHHRVHLNVQCKADIAWWLAFVREWSSVAFFPNLQAGAAVVADASGTWGCGAYTRDSLDWFQLPWPAAMIQTTIATKELLPLAVAAALWEWAWHGTRVQFISDNQAMVTVLTAWSARDPQMMHILRCPFYFQVLFRFELRAEHMPVR